MQRLLIKTLFEQSETYSEKIVTVCGWARTIRDSKVFGFIELNDGSCFKSLQIVFEQGQIDNFEEIAKLKSSEQSTTSREVLSVLSGSEAVKVSLLPSSSNNTQSSTGIVL